MLCVYAHILHHVLSCTIAPGSSAQQASIMIQAAPFKKMPYPDKQRPARLPKGTVASCLPVPGNKAPVHPSVPPPAHLLASVQPLDPSPAPLTPKDEDDDEDEKVDRVYSVGVAELVEEIIDSDDGEYGQVDPCAVRFKNLHQFCDKAVFEAWLNEYFNLPADGHVMKLWNVLNM